MDDAKLKLGFRLVPVARPADAVVLDDIVRLIRQAAATAPKQAAVVSEPAGGFREPTEDESRTLRGLEAKIENRIQEASGASQSAVEKRAVTGDQPDASLKAAEALVGAVQRAIIRHVTVRVPDPTP